MIALRQTLAILLDAYRELNARKLFWIVMGLSCFLVAVFAAAGIDERGIKIFKWTIDAPINTKVMTPAVFYKAILFMPLGYKLWLAWGATILALISTASIIPDFVASGAVELSLARPIGRLRLFATKWVCGMLFVALQVSVFSFGGFLVLGIRGHSWEPVLFLSIPLVVAMYSFLYSVCALVGLRTRSAVGALLVTLVFWFVIFIVHSGEAVTLQLQTQTEQRIVAQEKRRERQAADVEKLTAQLAEFNASPRPEGTSEADRAADTERTSTRLDERRTSLTETEKKLGESRESQKKIDLVHGVFYGIKTVLPKTTETLGLLERKLYSMSDLKGVADAARGGAIQIDDDSSDAGDQRSVAERIDETLRGRSVAWVLGTSLAFEGLVLGLAGWIFCRRDF